MADTELTSLSLITSGSFGDVRSISAYGVQNGNSRQIRGAEFPQLFGASRHIAEYDLTGVSSQRIPDFASLFNLVGVELRFSGVEVGHDGTEIVLNLEQNSVVKSDSSYRYSRYGWQENTAGFGGSLGTGNIPLGGGSTVGTGAFEFFEGRLYIDRPLQGGTSHFVRAETHMNNTNTKPWGNITRGNYEGTDATSAIDAIIISVNTATFQNGFIDVFGIFK